MIDTTEYQVRTPPPPLRAQRGRSTAQRGIAWLLVVLGIGLGGFGAYRLVSHYGEVNRLNDRLSTVRAERADLEGRVAEVRGRVEAMSASSAGLDAAVGDMVEALEAYTEAYQETVTWYNAALNATLSGNWAQAEAIAEGEYVDASRAAEEAQTDLEASITAAEAALADARGSLGAPAEG